MPTEKRSAEKNPPEPVVNTTKAQNFRSVYANNAVFEVSVFDVRMTFGESTRESETSMNVEQQVSIVMSPQHAKIFANTLLSNLQAYERQIAEIVLPKRFFLPSSEAE